MPNKFERKKFGFSLIELMVSVTLFAIVMMVAMGTILSIVDGNKKNQAYVVAIGNLNYAVDNMTREIKTGYGYQSGVNSGFGCAETFTFHNTNDDELIYSLEDDGGVGRLYIKYIDASIESYVTAPEIDITSLCFKTIGNEPGDGFQPAVMIHIGGETITGKENIKTKFNISTSVTQRQVDF